MAAKVGARTKFDSISGFSSRPSALLFVFFPSRRTDQLQRISFRAPTNIRDRYLQPAEHRRIVCGAKDGLHSATPCHLREGNTHEEIYIDSRVCLFPATPDVSRCAPGLGHCLSSVDCTSSQKVGRGMPATDQVGNARVSCMPHRGRCHKVGPHGVRVWNPPSTDRPVTRTGCGNGDPEYSDGGR